MKLSEAILLGSVGTGQVRGIFRDDQGNTCAWGAAFTAQGIEFDNSKGIALHKMEGRENLPQEWHWVFHYVNVPRGLTHIFPHLSVVQIWSIIPVLNDCLEWTRPQIAAWVAQMEAKYCPDSVRPKEEQIHATT